MDFSLKKRNANLYLKYTGLFILVAFFVYGTYFITGHSLIWYIDAANQHLPLLIDFKEDVTKFIHHPSFSNLPMWSSHLGLGNDAFQIYSYYLLGDIFTYIALLFPASKMIIAYQLMIMLRLYCAGLAFCWCAKHFNLKTTSILTGSLVYVFNAFLLYSNIAQPFFTLPFIIFPFLIVNLERVIQGKSIWPLMWTFTWMLLNNFYFAYILGIGTFIYLVLRLFWSRHVHRNYVKLFAKLAWVTILSILNSAILLLPEIIAVKNSTRAGSDFANGLKVYPLYYYLNLPGQLINGGNRDFYFWSALGFASIAFFAIIYILKHFKQYKIIGSTLILSGIMLLIPACAAFFNGFMAPSNRWTLMLALPIALSCSILVENINNLSVKIIKLFVIWCGIYLAYISIDYFFQNNEKMFVPVIFLLVFLICLLLIYHYHFVKSATLILIVTLLNVILNAVYFEAPYNGGYAEEMLPLGSFKKLNTSAYGDLTNNLTNDGTYRISTISNNEVFGNNFKMYNNLDPKVNAITSYYSLQNKYVGQFALDLQNSQYEANYPIQQFNDRSILENFLGVKYLFVQSHQKNAQKIPASFIPEAASVQNISNGEEIIRYKSENAFPLMYWQNHQFSLKQYQKMSASQKERALASGVVVNNAKTNLKKASVTNQVIEIPFKLVSSRGNQIDPQHIEQLTKDETYQLVIDTDKLTPKQKEALRNAEIHLELENISYTPLTLMQQTKLQAVNADYDSNKGILNQDSQLNFYKYFRSNIINGTPNTGFTISATTPYGTETLKQPKPYILSFYKVVKNGIMNLGYYQKAPSEIQLKFANLGTYSLKLKVTATPLNSKYQDQVKQIQQHQLQDVKYGNNQLSGKITAPQNGVLTSSIPYSSGWKVFVNGRQQKVLRTNTAFLGVKVDKGTSHVKFVYETPGLKVGTIITLVGLLLSCLSWLIPFLIHKFR